MSFSHEIRLAITLSGKSCYRISQEAGVDRATLSRFMNSKGGLSTEALDRLAECLEMSVSCGGMDVKSLLDLRLLHYRLLEETSFGVH